MARFNWDAFAGGVAKGIQTEQDMRIKRKAAAREETRFQNEQSDRQIQENLRKSLAAVPKVGDVNGAQTYAPKDFGSEQEANDYIAQFNTTNPSYTGELSAPVDTSGLQVAPVPQMTARGGVAPAPRAALPTQGAPVAAPSVAPIQALPPQAADPTFAKAAPDKSLYGDIDPAKAVVYRDPTTGKYRVTDETNARKVHQADVISYQAAAYNAAGQPEKAIALQREGMQLLAATQEMARKKALTAFDMAVATGGATEGTLNKILSDFSRDNDITLGADFKVMKTDRGYTIGAAPDGAGTPPMALPGMGMFKDPADGIEAIRALISGSGFGELRQQIFDNSIKLDEKRLKQQIFAETVRSNKVGEAQRGRGLDIQAGSAKSEADYRTGQLKIAGEKTAPDGIPERDWKGYQKDVDRLLAVMTTPDLGEAQRQAYQRQSSAFKAAYRKTHGVPTIEVPGT